MIVNDGGAVPGQLVGGEPVVSRTRIRATVVEAARSEDHPDPRAERVTWRSWTWPGTVPGLQNMTTMSQSTAVTTVRFDATAETIGKTTLLRLPEKASKKLPSRGQVAVQGTIDGHRFQTVLEPDGGYGHWMRLDGKLRKTAALRAGDTATVAVEPVKDWPEPSVPQDLKSALAAAPQKIQDMWKDITPMARWEWVRWVNATLNPETRQRRVEVTISKMQSGKRRPCCFNLAGCTDPNLTKNGKLIAST